VSREELQTIIEWLIANHFMLKTKGQYPVLHPTYEGMHYGEKITVLKLKKLKKCLEEEVILWK
jgi:DNA helicase-4